MKKLIPGWVHNPGVHCASTVISDILTFHGQSLDEAMCFGIGSGLGFFYLHSTALSPTHTTAVRSRVLEETFFKNIGRPFEWILEQGPEQALESARNLVNKQIPFLMKADIAHLPHYNTATHFPGHVIAMWGYDDEKQTALVADTGWEGLIEVSYSKLEKARFDGWSFMRNAGDHYPVKEMEPLPDLVPIIRKSLLRQAEYMAGKEIAIPENFGFKGMAKAVEAMPGWGEAEDWQWCARWFYQCIEKRGTGGGAFRLLYSRFLEQAGKIDPALVRAAPPEEMKDIAKRWTELSYAFKEISEQEKPQGFEKAADILDDIREREERFFTQAMDEVS